MEANSTDKKTFQLTENGQALGELGYKNLFSLKAEIKLPNAEYYEIAPLALVGSVQQRVQSPLDRLDL